LAWRLLGRRFVVNQSLFSTSSKNAPWIFPNWAIRCTLYLPDSCIMGSQEMACNQT
jgi:hypothetical protein